MSYKPDEATLVSYLYGELEPAAQQKVEAYLKAHPDEKQRLEAWSFTRSAMSGLPDKEVIAPPIILGSSTSEKPFWKENYFRMPLGIAASLLVFLVAAKLLDVSASYSEGVFKISFGARENTVPVNPGLNETQVSEMIRSSLSSNNEALQASWHADRKSMEQSIQKNLRSNSVKIDRLMQTASAASQEQLKGFVGQLQTDNLKLMKDYMQLSSAGQKEYIENLLVDFSAYLQEQRKQDWQVFQTRVNSLEKNTDQFKQETEQLLTSLITNGNTTNQRRN
jgi:hypothetical protein